MIMMFQILAMPVLGLALLVGMGRLERAVDAGRGLADLLPLHRRPHDP
jgi:hypothetical protein